jgi:hypothetical protein
VFCDFIVSDLIGSYRIISLPRIHDRRGDLTFIESEYHVPFQITRVYYLYNVPVDGERGGHAHRKLEQVIFALSGSFRIKVHNGFFQDEFWLRDPQKGLHLSNMVWREIDSFSQGAVVMVLASDHYCESDYIRDYDQFVREVRGQD